MKIDYKSFLTYFVAFLLLIAVVFLQAGPARAEAQDGSQLINFFSVTK